MHDLRILHVVLNLLLICLSVLGQLLAHDLLMILHSHIDILLDAKFHEFLELLISEDLGRWLLDLDLGLFDLSMNGFDVEYWLDHLDWFLLNLIGLIFVQVNVDSVCLWELSWHLLRRSLLLHDVVLLWGRLLGVDRFWLSHRRLNFLIRLFV